MTGDTNDSAYERLAIAIPLFPRFTALDAIGPYEVLQRIPWFDITFVGHEKGEVRSDNAMLGITVDATFEDLPEPDLVVFPGGVGTRPLEHDKRVLDWVRHAHESTRLTTSVCTGSLVLGAAGLAQEPDRHDALVVLSRARGARRGARHPNVSSSTWTRGSSPLRAFQAASTWRYAWSSCWSTAPRPKPSQLMIEYDPQPTVDTGSLAKASDPVVSRVVEYAKSRS